MSNPTIESPLCVDSKANTTPGDVLAASAVDPEEGVKCCRICLEEEDSTDRMIAPCLCKGSMKWVHRSCLDEWRRNEQDRAFAQCTECHFHYHFIEKEEQPDSFWNQPRTKFCLFISRDIFVVTLVLQCIIGLFSLVIMLLDQSQSWNMTHAFDTADSPYRECFTNSSNSSSNVYSGSTSGLTYCHHHALAMYYLFGVIALLATVGLVGTTIYCCNGCRMPPLGDHRGSQYEALDDAEAPKVSMQRGDLATAESNVHRNFSSERRTQYYRDHRRRRRNRADDCCLCCGSSTSSSPNYYYHTPNNCCVFYDGASAGSDCCCCCCDEAESSSGGGDCCCNGPHHSAANNNCSCDGDATAVMFFVLLLFLIVMAVIGLFMVLFIGVVVCQRIVQRHMFRLQKRQLVNEFQVADLATSSNFGTNGVLSGSGKTYPFQEPLPSSSSTLHPNDQLRLKKLGLLLEE